MQKISLSNKIYLLLIIILAILSALNVFLPQGDFLAVQEIEVSKTVLASGIAALMLILYGGLGYFGLKLSKKIAFADIWDSKVSNKERFLFPALIGIFLGIIFIILDLILTQFHTLGSIPHPPFPTSIIASATAAIGEEIIYRLFFISFWVWLISNLILKRKRRNKVFWIITLFSALLFASAHLPSIIALYGLNTLREIPFAIILEIFILNGLLSISAAYYLRKFGLLAAVGIHFWADIVWHVLWGLF
ncbi:CPBP family glutamic-type intramembrane protease [Halanaerobium kushneri]|uniref:CAAX protease self-immunity n=1 Tax=Halanaerobium kushneri TaxID=56779 RepID=A0A1N6PL16_9FIRM|nr:CPBP family glutamic-type intramembrane protease [Halanaerobium kushneri]SIQ05031.1 CAAX protease self-immunity [Halanaerobium kushneri]